MRLKQLVAELTLDKTMLQDVLSKNGEAFAAWTDGGASGCQIPGERAAACRVLRLARATYRYKRCLDPRTELRMRIREIAQASKKLVSWH